MPFFRKYTLIIEGDSAGYSGYVPELPTILVTGKSIEDLTARAKEAIGLYWESLHADCPQPQRFGKLRSNCRSRRSLACIPRLPLVARMTLFLLFTQHAADQLRQVRVSIRLVQLSQQNLLLLRSQYLDDLMHAVELCMQRRGHHLAHRRHKLIR